ncbi:hypothetical protein [Priestia megaterium]|uniref:hypothetical protein n=1 Tax=Priestia megaterium TaxID=1404 RepID=UPI00399000CC
METKLYPAANVTYHTLCLIEDTTECLLIIKLWLFHRWYSLMTEGFERYIELFVSPAKKSLNPN